METVLVVDDDTQMLQALDDLLGTDVRVLPATSTAEAVRVLSSDSVSAIITDYRLTGPSGLDLVQFVQTLQPRPPVILLSAFIDKDIAIQCVNAGVYGVIEKPFGAVELRHRLRSALDHFYDRTRGPEKSSVTGALGEIVLHPQTLEVTFNSRRVRLTSTEYGIFSALLANRDEWVSRAYLEKNVWGNRRVSRNLFDTHFSNLRKKIPELKDSVHALRGRGYSLSTKSEASQVTFEN